MSLFFITLTDIQIPFVDLVVYQFISSQKTKPKRLYGYRI